MGTVGKGLIALGIVVAVTGLVLIGADRLGIQRLPGDITIRRGNFTAYFPIATCLLESAVLTLILNLIFRRR
jgi:hypothetical protein